ncbi:hypothetical protein C2E23DRAFT_863721 [Lenzites betulinus]|nr:hypothetical protein C2E23DRAFT_863721 [Lenzites betulinus]
MCDPLLPSELYNFQPPRAILDDDSAFPEGTIVTFDSTKLGIVPAYSKGSEGRWYLETLQAAAFDVDSIIRLSARKRYQGEDIPCGSIAKFNAGAEIAYEKGDEGWILCLEGQIMHPAEDEHPPPSPRHENTYKNRQCMPTELAPIEYHATPLAAIIDNKMVVQDATSAAYGEAVGNQKLSLRLQFPELRYDRPQFNVRFTKERKIIARGDLALHIATEMRDHMDEAGKRNTPLRHEGKVVEFGQLVLMSVTFQSKGSIQPIFGVLCE